MTLRESLSRDVQRVHEQVDALLDREDGLLVLFDGGRMVSYTQGFGISPDQLELLSVELERAVRNVVAAQPTTSRMDRRTRVADGRRQSVRLGNAAHGDRGGATSRVLRLESTTA